MVAPALCALFAHLWPHLPEYPAGNDTVHLFDWASNVNNAYECLPFPMGCTWGLVVSYCPWACGSASGGRCVWFTRSLPTPITPSPRLFPPPHALHIFSFPWQLIASTHTFPALSVLHKPFESLQFCPSPIYMQSSLRSYINYVILEVLVFT